MKYLVDNINNYSDNDYNYFLGLINHNKKKEILKINSNIVRKRKILGEVLLIKLLESINIKYNNVSIYKNEFGKPCLNCDIFYNISHSYDMVVCVISYEEIGIDIELIRDINFSVIKYICCENEFNFINNSSNINYYGFSLFTLKEAYFKCLGTNLFNIKSVNFNINENIIACSDSSVNCFQYKLGNYILSICKKKKLHYDL